MEIYHVVRYCKCYRQFVKNSKIDLFTLCSDWEQSPLRVLHTREGVVWRCCPEASGAASPLVQHGNYACTAWDAGEYQRGDPTSGQLSLTQWSSLIIRRNSVCDYQRYLSPVPKLWQWSWIQTRQKMVPNVTIVKLQLNSCWYQTSS